MYYIGVDLGTSAVKLLLMEADGSIRNVVSKEYPLYFPHPGWSEQKPEDWWNAVVEGIQELVPEETREKVAGMSFGGQMHGLVMLDENDEVIRPAILWNDGRTGKETNYLNEVIGKDKLSEYTANIAFAGFTAPKILWVKENEPENFARISKIMLPKDYLAYRLTGTFCTDVSDASGMLIFDVKNKCWSEEMLKICGIRKDQVAKIYESYECVGTLKPEVAALLKLPESVRVAAGAGDNAAAAVGTGTVGDGQCNISLGTSGTIFVSSEKFCVDSNNAHSCFCPREWQISSDGLYAQRRFLQQVVDGRDHWHEGLCRRAGEDHETWRKSCIFPSLSDGRAFSPQQSGCPRNLHWHEHGHHESRHDPGCPGRCGFRHP